MMINIEREQLMALGEAGRLLGWQPSPATLWRWRVKGVRNVRLDCIRIGGRWLTSREAILRFVKALASSQASVVPANVDDLEAALIRAGLR